MPVSACAFVWTISLGPMRMSCHCLRRFVALARSFVWLVCARQPWRRVVATRWNACARSVVSRPTKRGTISSAPFSLVSRHLHASIAESGAPRARWNLLQRSGPVQMWHTGGPSQGMGSKSNMWRKRDPTMRRYAASLSPLAGRPDCKALTYPTLSGDTSSAPGPSRGFLVCAVVSSALPPV